MTRYIILTASFILIAQLKAQTLYMIDQNNAHALISDDGVFFSNQVASTASYEIPAGSGNHTMYAMSFWMGGLDVADQLHVAGQTYGSGQDFFAGPIANDYNSPYYLSTYPSAIWKVTKGEINFHVNNYTAIGYVPDPAIANWPGNGNVSEGIAQQLAPYVDVNGDHIYNPANGDYPYIQGDQAVYVIINDAAGDHTNTGGDSLGVEIHIMFYQFNSIDADIENTTFMNVKLFNRSTTNYHDFYFGMWMDYDLGFAANDYIGCDSTRNLSYVYNGNSTDDGQGGQPGYGANVPAFGALMLNEPMGAFMYYNIGGGVTGDPTNASGYYNYLQGIWQNGDHVLYGGNGYNSGTTTTETNFMYSGNPYLGTGWNEFSQGNPSGDRRVLMATTGHDFLAAESNCIDFAFIYNGDSSTLENANELLSTADFVQNYYDNNIQPCNQIFLANGERTPTNFLIFPNPSDGKFYVELAESTTLSIYNLNGQLVATENCIVGKNEINLNLNNGFYIVQLKTTDAISYLKIEVIK